MKPSTASDHPTLIPLYDVEKAAKEAAPPAADQFREEMPTLTDPVELETARVRSSFTVPPPAMPAGADEKVSEAGLREAYEKRFGGFAHVPSVVMTPAELSGLQLDGRAGMLLAFLDGRSTIQDILDIGVISPLDALAALKELLERGVVVFR